MITPDDSDSDDDYTDDDADSEMDADEEPVNIDTFYRFLRDEMEYADSIKPPNRYYIGYDIRKYSVLDIAVQASTFLTNRYESVANYLRYQSSNGEMRPIEIMWMTYGGEFESYDVVLKTHWLRLVQRTWKRVYAERKKCIRRIIVADIPDMIVQWTKLPSIRGMLAGI